MGRIDRVKPVRRYRAAKYPSHVDPDPTTVPAPVQFPFRRELVRAVAGVGLTAALFGCGASDDDTPPTPAKAAVAAPAQDKPAFQDPRNMFGLSRTGLPHQTSPYGTGQPAYLGEEAARHVIDRIFKEEGFLLERRVRIDREDAAFRATGYDSARGIGYVYGSWSTLDEDAIISWAHPKERMTPTATDSKGVRTWLESVRWRLEGMPKEIKDRAAAVGAMPDGPELMEAYRKLFQDVHAELLSLAEIKAVEETAPKTKQFIAVVSSFSPRYVVSGGNCDTSKLQALQEKARQEPNPQAQEELYRKIQMLYAEDTLKTLERDVREFIAWARTQGLR